MMQENTGGKEKGLSARAAKAEVSGNSCHLLREMQALQSDTRMTHRHQYRQVSFAFFIVSL
jgi:hypothetical protein